MNRQTDQKTVHQTIAIPLLIGIIPLIMPGCSSGPTIQVSPKYTVSGAEIAPVTNDNYQSGLSYFRKGIFGLALIEFQAALRKHPDSVRALNGMGACYDQLGRYNLAMRYYHKALQIDPISSKTLHNLGHSLTLQKRYTESERIKKIVQQQRKNEALTPESPAASQPLTTTEKQNEPEVVANEVKTEPLAFIKAETTRMDISWADATVAEPQSEPEAVTDKVAAEPPAFIVTNTDVMDDDWISAIVAKPQSKAEGINHDMPALAVEPEAPELRGMEQQITKTYIQVEAHPTNQQKEEEAIAVDRKEETVTSVPDPAEAVSIRSETVVEPPASMETIVSLPADGPPISISPAEKEIPDETPTTTADLLYGPVKSGEKLWHIANRLAEKRSVPTKEMLLALIRSNPEAFYRDNPNRLKTGYTLWVPDDNALADQPLLAAKDKESTPPNATLEVANGNGRIGMAKTFRHYLSHHGMEVSSVSDAASFTLRNSVVYFKTGYRAAAEQLATMVPMRVEIKPYGDMQAYRNMQESTDVKLIIGHDVFNYEGDLRRTLLRRNQSSQYEKYL
ncbi:MAG: FimV/HubP family polar landmark protein [Sedimenticola sp.]